MDARPSSEPSFPQLLTSINCVLSYLETSGTSLASQLPSAENMSVLQGCFDSQQVQFEGWSAVCAGANFMQSAGPPYHPRLFARNSEKTAWVGQLQCDSASSTRRRITSPHLPISTSCRVSSNPLQGPPDIDHPDRYSWSTLSRHIYLSQNKWVNWVRTQESGRDQPLSQLVIISCDLSEQSRPRMHLVTMDSRTYHTMWREGNFTADIARSLRQMTHDGGAIERFNAGQCCTSPEERN